MARKRPTTRPRKATKKGKQAAKIVAKAGALTVTEVAELMGCGRTTVYALIKSGELRTVKVGSCRRVHADDLAEYLEGLRRTQ